MVERPRPARHAAPLFLEHFRGTSLLVEHEDRLVGFLVGYLCPDHPDEAYVHFAGVAPEWRRAGLARELYRRFGALARADGRTAVRAVTRRSIPAPSPFTPPSASPSCPVTTSSTACPSRRGHTARGRLPRRASSSPRSGGRRCATPASGFARGSARHTPPARPPAASPTPRRSRCSRAATSSGAGARADAVRRRLHPGDEVTFIVDRNINYTDYCLSGCRFCAFYKKPGSGEGYLLAEADIHRKIEETLALGGTAIMMQGGLHPDLDICWFEQVFGGIKARYPIHIHSLSPPEIVHIARQSGLSVEETLTRLHAAGLDSLPGGGAEVLVDRVRTAISPHKIPTDTWLDVMRVAHGLGMKTTATMMFGSLDTLAERVEHLRRIRDLQDEPAASPPSSRGRSRPATRSCRPATSPAPASTTCMMLAVTRIYLDNVPNVQASWVTQGLRMGQVALAFGANDMGSTMIEENVVAAAGVRNQCDVDEMVRLIRAAGRTPVQRDTLYREVRRY